MSCSTIAGFTPNETWETEPENLPLLKSLAEHALEGTILLPPAYEVRREVYVFTGVCLLTGGRGVGTPDQDRGTHTSSIPSDQDEGYPSLPSPWPGQG